MRPALCCRRRLVVFGWVELDEKLFRSRCAVLTLVVVTFVVGRVSRSRIAFERSSAVDGVGRTVRVGRWWGNPDSLRVAKKVSYEYTYVVHARAGQGVRRGSKEDAYCQFTNNCFGVPSSRGFSAPPSACSTRLLVRRRRTEGTSYST